MNRNGMIVGIGALLLVAVALGVGGESTSGGTGVLTGLVVLLAAGVGVLASRQRQFDGERARLEALVLRTDEQLRIGEKLTSQADALPVAAEALVGISERIASLETSWASAHREATQETLSVVQDAILSFRADAKQAIEDGARVAREAVTPIIESVVEGTVGAGREVVAEHAARLDQLETAQSARAEALLAQLGNAVGALRDVGAEQAGAIAGFAQEAEARLLQHERAQAATLADWVDTLSEAQRTQAEQRAQLEARLVEAGAAAVDAMRERLEAHAEKLSAELGRAGGAVDAAASLAQAGGAELTAVAEMFAAAVERQNDGARAWLESLTEVEAAVETAGRAAAADALGRQLAETKGVFARQLEFQRALLAQVQDLRADVARLEAGDAPEASAFEAADAEDAPAFDDADDGVAMADTTDVSDTDETDREDDARV